MVGCYGKEESDNGRMRWGDGWEGGMGGVMVEEEEQV